MWHVSLAIAAVLESAQERYVAAAAADSEVDSDAGALLNSIAADSNL